MDCVMIAFLDKTPWYFVYV